MGFGYGKTTSHNADAINRVTGERAAKIASNIGTAHAWASGNQTFGQSSNGNLYFAGRVLFSYGTHYPVGYILPGEPGRAPVLLNSDSSSVTTGGHKSDARSAVRGRDSYHVPNLDRLLGDLRTPYASIESTERFESEIDARLNDRAHVRQFCETNALSIDSESLQFLLARVGLPNSADAITRKAQAARDKAEKREAAKDKAQAIDLLCDVASGTDSEFAERVAAQVNSGYSWARESAADSYLNDLGKRIRKARRAAGKDSVPPAIWAKAWQRLGEIALGESLSHTVNRDWHKLQGIRGAESRRKSVRDVIAAYRNPHKDAYALANNAHRWHALAHEARAYAREGRAARELAGVLATHYPLTMRGAIEKLIAESDSRYEAERLINSSRELADAKAHYQANEAAERERERLAAIERAASDLVAWRAGLPTQGRVYASRESGAAYIRAVDVKRGAAGAIIGGELETSQGASVPLVHAVKAFQFIKLVRERGTPWERNGATIRVGLFQVDSISAAGDMVAGCHRFAWQDIAALAESLGVFAAPASDSAIETK